MPIRKASHMMLGMLHQGRPMWEHGCILYWRAVAGLVLQNPGGAYVDGDPEFTYTYSSTERYTYFDPGRGHYLEVDRPPNPSGDGVDPIVPKDGHFAPQRINTYPDSTPLNTRDFSTQAGLAVVLGGQISDWILKEDPGFGISPRSPLDTFRVQNLSGVSKRAYIIAASTSATDNHLWSILAKRAGGGGPIDGTILSMGATDSGLPETGGNLISGTVYRKLRSDGWYQISGILPPQVGGPSRTFFVELEDGANVFIECPQIEEVAVGELLEPTAPIVARPAPATRVVHDLEMPVAGGFNLPASGWMGCTVIPRTDNPSPAHPFGSIVEWRIDTDNRQRFLYSNTFNTVAFQTEVGGVSQAFLQLQSSDIEQGIPIGMCATWGLRNGSTYFYLCANGQQIELDTNGAIPVGGPTRLMIGSQGGPNPSPVMLPECAVGAVNISRHDCRLLSQWFQDRGFSSLAAAGA